MIVDIIIILTVSVVMLAAGYVYINSNRIRTVEEELKIIEIEATKISLTVLKVKVLEMINEYTRESLFDKGYTKEVYQKEENKRNRLKASLEKCKYGSRQDKETVKDYIYDMLYQLIPEALIDDIIPFNNPSKMTGQEKFDSLLYIYKEKQDLKGNAMRALVKENHLDQAKHLIEDGLESYIITEEEIIQQFNTVYFNYNLTARDKLMMITQRVYQEIKGLGVIDELRDQNIDGISGGVSGRISVDVDDISVKEFISQYKSSSMNYDAVWFMFEGKSIHLSFLSFGSEGELIRVCRNIYRHNRPGEISESVGYMINDMADNSRVVVARPPFCESWVFFVRKFSKDIKSLNELYNEDNTPGADMLKQLLSHFVRGHRILAITGSQGVGKTTVLKAIIKEIKPTLPLRINEMAFEVHGRDLYSDRNIVTFREWGKISGKEGLDLQKKTDGSVNILGEIATDEVAAMMIEMAQVASLFTIFTHHAKTTENLVESIRNSLLKEDVFRDETIAINQVIEVLDFDVHLSKNNEGKRYVERVTEIVPEAKIIYDDNFDELTEEEAKKKFYAETMKFYQGTTGRARYKTKDIIIYKNGRYEPSEQISESMISKMKDSMNNNEQEAFKLFLKESWG